GSITGTDGVSYPYTVKEGLNILETMKVQLEWTAEFINRFTQLVSDNPGVSQNDLIVSNNLQDSHWNWVIKAHDFINRQDYIWFSLHANSAIQAMVIVYHPEKSRLEDRDVYYIDYLAVAPWNRVIGSSDKEFKGLGTLLLKEVGKYFDVSLKYPYGFSLHSLPQAATYYQGIGMVDFGPDPKKDNLHYFEMDSVDSKGFVYA
ncbi:MAG: hypothetical protein ABJH28_17485, partial [Paraglaciecola sp.]